MVSVTGIGKTFLAAFDALVVNRKGLLFVGVTENIARAVNVAFNGFLANMWRWACFSAMRGLAMPRLSFRPHPNGFKGQQLEAFRPDHFDYIIIDEPTERAAPRTGGF